MKKISASDLREMIREGISESALVRRLSLSEEEKFIRDITDEDDTPTDEEVTDFIMNNRLFDVDLIEQLVDPGLLGFSAKYANVNEEWLEEFKENIYKWSNETTWIGGDKSIVPYVFGFEPDDTELWIPDNEIIVPSWIETSPSYLLLAKQLIEKGKLLSNLNWRDFEKLIGDLLEKDGWNVVVTQATKDGGIDIIADKIDVNIGNIKSVWQAKKYSGKNFVKLKEVRELYAIREEQKASKALMVTTNRLTRDAIKWIKKDEYRFGYKDNKDLEKWIKRLFDK